MEGPASAYVFVKYLHEACVAASLAGFAVRGALTGRYPILTFDGCGKGCAREWVRERARNAECAFALEPREQHDRDPEAATARIAAEFPG